jgi:AraC-like DNA-binding protein
MPDSRNVTVALLAAGAEHQVAAAEELEGIRSVRYCETVERLIHLVERGGVDVVVTQLRDAHSVPIAPAIAPLHDRHPGLPIVAYLIPTPATLRDVPSALAAGVSECSVRGHDQLGRAVRVALALGWHQGAARPLLDTFRSLLSSDLDEFAIACAIKASPQLSPERVADWIRTSERTLRARLQRLALKPPSEFIEFGSAVHAAYLLDRLGLEAYQVAQILGFAGRRALNRLLRHYAGKGAREFRQHDDFETVLEATEQFLRRPASQNVLSTGVTMDIIDRYLTGDLTPEEQVELERKLVDHPEVAEYLAEMRRVLAAAPNPEVVRKYKLEVWARLKREIGRGMWLLSVLGGATGSL